MERRRSEWIWELVKRNDEYHAHYNRISNDWATLSSIEKAKFIARWGLPYPIYYKDDLPSEISFEAFDPVDGPLTEVLQNSDPALRFYKIEDPRLKESRRSMVAVFVDLTMYKSSSVDEKLTALRNQFVDEKLRGLNVRMDELDDLLKIFDWRLEKLSYSQISEKLSPSDPKDPRKANLTDKSKIPKKLKTIKKYIAAAPFIRIESDLNLELEKPNANYQLLQEANLKPNEIQNATFNTLMDTISKR